MAQPIRATPTLAGGAAQLFLKKMKEREKVFPSKADKKLLDLISAHYKEFHV